MSIVVARRPVLRRLRAVPVAAAVLCAPGLISQAAAQATIPTNTLPRNLGLQPSASITQTFSDNFSLTGIDPTADSITRLTAGVSLRGQTGLVRGFLDYSLSSLVYARHTEQNGLQNSLNMVLGADVVPGRARVDVTGNIAQGAISAFGVQPTAGGATQSNSTETRNFRITPSVRGPLGPDYVYSGQLAYAISDAKSTALGSSNTASAALHLEPTTHARLGWALDGSVVRSDYKAGRSTADDRLYATANMRVPSMDLQLQANGGVESSDIDTGTRRSYGNWGLGANWAPSPRTRLSADYSHRFYGASHNLSFEHRTALTVWHLTSSHSLSTDEGLLAGSGRGTAFDLFYKLFESQLPDPAQRADFVTQFLATPQGAQAAAAAGFLRSSVTLQDRQELSVAWRGLRSTAVLALTRSTTQRVGAQPVLGDLNATAEVRLRGFSLNLSHRLTPLSSLSATISHSHSSGVGIPLGSSQRLFNVQYTTRPGLRSELSVGMRRSLYEQAPASFDENAIFATYGIRF